MKSLDISRYYYHHCHLGIVLLGFSKLSEINFPPKIILLEVSKVFNKRIFFAEIKTYW